MSDNPLACLQNALGTYLRTIEGTDCNGHRIVIDGYTLPGYPDDDLYNRCTYTCWMLSGVSGQEYGFVDEITKNPDKFPNAEQLATAIRDMTKEQIVKICDHFDKYVGMVMEIMVKAAEAKTTVPAWVRQDLVQLKSDLDGNGFIAKAIEDLRRNPEADYAYRKCKEWMRRLVPDQRS